MEIVGILDLVMDHANLENVQMYLLQQVLLYVVLIKTLVDILGLLVPMFLLLVEHLLLLLMHARVWC